MTARTGTVRPGTAPPAEQLRRFGGGALALVASFIVGIGVVGESLDDVLGGFPVDALIILLGITYLFGIARETGTIDWLVGRSISLIGNKVALLPWALWLIATGVVNILFRFSTSLWAFALLWALNAFFQGWGAPVCARLLTAWYSPNERGGVWAIWNTSHSVGRALIPMVVG